LSGYVVHIEPKSADAEDAARVLARVLGEAEKTEVTPADAATLSGLPLDRCEPALLLLASRFPSRMRVTESGALLFTFASLRPTRPAGRFARLVRAARAWLREKREQAVAVSAAVLGPPVLVLVCLNMGALAFYAQTLPWWGAIPIDVVVWPVLFVTFTLAFLSIVLLELFPLIGIALIGIGVTMPLIPFIDGMGESLGTRIGIALVLALAAAMAITPGVLLARLGFSLFRDVVNEPKHATTKAIWRGVGGLLLGPPRAHDDGLSDERRLVALIRERRGVLVESDLMALFGWTRAEAGAELARIVADYGGDIEVTDDGAILYRFDPLLQTAGHAAAHADTRPAWKLETSPPVFFGSPGWATGWTLVAIAIALAGLTFVPGLALLPDRAAYARIVRDDAAAFEGLGAWPYLAVLGVLAIRAPFWMARRIGFQRRARLLALLRVAVESPDGARVPRPNASDLASLGGELVAELPDANDLWLVRFPDLALAARARKRAAPAPRAVVGLGPVVFDTAKEAGPPPVAAPIAEPPKKKRRQHRRKHR
jgi:hypothetical protein